MYHYRVLFRHSHGGTGCGSAHKPFLASRASFSTPSSTLSLAHTSDTTSTSLAGRVPDSGSGHQQDHFPDGAFVLSRPWVWMVTSVPKARAEAACGWFDSAESLAGCGKTMLPR